ncbi:chitinase-3-like protein 1 isoform X1 [Littorina saxatilis]|uniref:Chitinase n=1 Tax=Littorina saxatilis TaxID=31220 RepID=A0AAN9GMF4_9CAEN
MSTDKMMYFGMFILLQVLTPVVTQRVRMCYYTSWSQSRFRPSDIDATLCTHIIYAFARVNSVDNTLATVRYNDLELYNNVTSLKAKNPDLKVLLAVGGFNFGSAGFIAVAQDDKKTTLFADNAVNYLRQHRFDGLDVDWEFPNPSTRGIYQRFVQRLREAFQREAAAGNGTRLLLTLAVSANHEIASTWYGPNTLMRYADYILLMTYDFWGTWINRLANHSPLYIRPQDANDIDLGRFSANKTVQTWLSQGASREKLVMGFATYARTATMNSVEENELGDLYNTRQKGSPGRLTGESGLLSYSEMCENLQNDATNWRTVFEASSGVPHAYRSAWPLDWVSYDNPTSFRTKAEYIVEQGLAGAMIWSLDFDDYLGQYCNLGSYPLISQIKSVFQNQSDLERPTPAANAIPTTRVTNVIPTTRVANVMSTTLETNVVATNSPGGSAGARTLPTTGTTTTTESNPRRCLQTEKCPEAFGYYADCTNCTRFFHCSFHVPHTINCPPGLRYQAHLSVCDWPGNVYCPHEDM